GAGAYLFEVVFAGVSLAIVWGAMAERAKLWVYFVFGVAFTLIYSVTSHWIWHSGGWLFGLGMQDFAGSTVVHYQGALAALAGGIATAWLVLKKPDVSMMLNGVIAALVAITAASGFVAPWAAIVIGFLAAAIAVVAVPLVERIGIDDPIGAVAVHGLAGVWGTL